VLVTGGAGFIGSTLVDRLLAEGCDVDAIDDLSTGALGNLTDARAQRSRKFSFHRLDVRSPQLADIVAHRKPEVIFHLAAQLDVRVSVARPLFDAEINVLGSLNVCEAALAAGTRKVVFAGSGGTLYGVPESLPVRESHPQRPISPYGVSKKAAGDYLHYYREVRGLEYTELALANVYGPRQDPNGEAGVVAIFAGLMLAGKQPTVFGDGGQTRDFVSAVLRRPCRQIPGTEAGSRSLEIAQAAAGRANDEGSDDAGGDQQHEEARDREQPASVPERAAERTAWRHDHQSTQGRAHFDRHHDDGRPGDVLGQRHRPALDASQAERRSLDDVVRQGLGGVAGDAAILHHDKNPADNRPILLPHVALQIEVGILSEIARDIGRHERRKSVRRATRQRLARARDDIGEQQALENQQTDDEDEEAKADAPVQRPIPAQIRWRLHRVHLCSRQAETPIVNEAM